MLRLSRRALGASVLAAPALGSAQSFPPGVIRVVVPYPPGGITDVLARGVAGPMGAFLGQSVAIENGAGANGSIGANTVARAPADGSVLLLGVTDTHAVNPAAMPNLPYDANRDFAPVALVTRVPLAPAVGPSQAQIQDLTAFIAAAKARPGGLTNSNWGVGSVSQIAMLRIAQSAGFELLRLAPLANKALLRDLATVIAPPDERLG